MKIDYNTSKKVYQALLSGKRIVLYTEFTPRFIRDNIYHIGYYMMLKENTLYIKDIYDKKDLEDEWREYACSDFIDERLNFLNNFYVKY